MTVLVAAASLAVAGFGTATPQLSVAPGTPEDVAELAAATFDRFIEAAPAVRNCIERIRLVSAWHLDDRGSYDAETFTVTIRIPGTAPRMAATMVHELAHHVDHVCLPDGVRTTFRRMQGLAETLPGTRSSWAEVLAEQFAEAMVEVVMGRRVPTLGVKISPEAAALVGRWARGS